MKQVIISTTATAHGFGSDPYKWVSNLTSAERQAVKAGDLVVFDSGHPEQGTSGSTWRKVILQPGGRWNRRCLSTEERALLREKGIAVW